MAHEKTTSEDDSREHSGNFREEIESLTRGEHSDPFALLGPHFVSHAGKNALAVRAFRANAIDVEIVWLATGAKTSAVELHPDGFFEALLPASVTASLADEMCIRDRIVSEPCGRARSDGLRSRVAPETESSSILGKYTLKLVPRPGSLYTQTYPPLCFTIP